MDSTMVEAIRSSVTIDWTQKETVRAGMRAKIKRLLRKHGYPPDKRQAAVDTVAADLLSLLDHWSEAA